MTFIAFEQEGNGCIYYTPFHNWIKENKLELEGSQVKNISDGLSELKVDS